VQYRLRGNNGNWVWVHDRATATLDAHGRPVMWYGILLDISDERALQSALRESEAHFRSIFEDAGIGMTLVAPDRTILIANPALGRLLGYTLHELVGTSVDTISFPVDEARHEECRRQMAAGEIDAYQSEKRYRRKDGSLIWARVDASAVRDEQGQLTAVIGQIQDITAWKATEEELRAREARFRALVQNDPDVIAVLDAEWHVVYMSPSARNAFGIAAQDLLGPVESRLQFIHPEEREAALGVIERVGGQPAATASTEARLWHEARRGWRWFQITVSNRLDDPGITGYVFNLRDITEQKYAELATTTALETQQTAIAELEQLNRSKSRFLSTISHEFRTPLTAIIGYSELLASNAADPKQVAEDAAVIHREASRLNRMVDDVLIIEQLDANGMSAFRCPVDLNTIARNVVKTFRPLTGKHTLTLDLDPALYPVAGNPDRLSQAVTNLVSNAIKYSPAGGKVSIATRNARDEVLLSVQDEGIGIAAKDIARIFDRFERVESGIAGRIPGTGLGLTIAREVATLHQGRLWAGSKPRVGSTFFLALPGQRDCEEPTATGHEDDTTGTSPPTRG
jgi:PAS domain S-box-containing protein